MPELVSVRCASDEAMSGWKVLRLDSLPRAIGAAWQDFRGPDGDLFTLRTPQSNFLKGCQWSPDGACLAAAADDGAIRLYDLPEDALSPADGAEDQAGPDAHSPAPRHMSAALTIAEGETIYSYAWYPGMTPHDPATCCLASTARGLPVHLWDAVTGHLRASYRAHDRTDSPTAAYSVGFSACGTRVMAGLKHEVRVFDVERPGGSCEAWVMYRRKHGGGVPGIVSTIGVTPVDPGVVAIGTYGGLAAVVDARTGKAEVVLEGHKGGVTQVLFGREGHYLYTGARADAEMRCWDVRAGQSLYVLQRVTPRTNQRMEFDIEPAGRHLVTGGEDGCLRGFDLRDGSEVACCSVAKDTVNGVSIHPWLPLVATASGMRRYPMGLGTRGAGDVDGEAQGTSGSARDTGSSGDESGSDSLRETVDALPGQPWTVNALVLWRLGHEPLEGPGEGQG